MRETTESIAKWADETFGLAPSLSRVAARANEEMAELLRSATSGQPVEDVIAEAADVVIVLTRLAHAGGQDLWTAVENKMAINRERKWMLDDSGAGYHV